MSPTRQARAAGAIVVANGIYPPETLLLEQMRASGQREVVAPKGGIKPGESLLAAARREVTEESGLTQLDYLDYLGQDAYEFAGKDGATVSKTVDWFLFATDQRAATPQLEEGFVGARWVPLSEAPRLVTHRSFGVFVRKASDLLARRWSRASGPR